MPQQQKSPEAAALKTRRAAAANANAAPAEPPLADVPVAIGESAARRYPVLFDPREPVHQPLEASGFATQGIVDDRYVLATEDASEQVYPPGCRTPVVRSLWRAGQHVPRHVFEAWQSRQQAAAEQSDAAPAEVIERQPEAPAEPSATP